MTITIGNINTSHWNNHTHTAGPPGPTGPIGPSGGEYNHKLTEGQRVEIVWDEDFAGQQGWVTEEIFESPEPVSPGYAMTTVELDSGVVIPVARHKLVKVSNLEALAGASDDSEDDS